MPPPILRFSACFCGFEVWKTGQTNQAERGWSISLTGCGLAEKKLLEIAAYSFFQELSRKTDRLEQRQRRGKPRPLFLCPQAASSRAISDELKTPQFKLH